MERVLYLYAGLHGMLVRTRQKSYLYARGRRVADLLPRAGLTNLVSPLHMVQRVWFE